jgi:MoxR-like ATPase
MNEVVESVNRVFSRAKEQIAKVIVGQDDVIAKALITIFTSHHALIEGVPGVAKTLLVRTLARVLGCDFDRIQFTPDLMPADITGSMVYNARTGEFVLSRGPVFTSFLLADEINRAPAKTQSALLQAMQERRVTIDRETHSLPATFTVFATQNPVEYEGTYPLPEAQRDRFMLKISMLPPTAEEETTLAARMLGSDAPEEVLAKGLVEPVISCGDLETVRTSLEAVSVRDEVVNYVVSIVRATREHDGILVGAGPRATQSLLLASRAQAAMEGRDFVVPDDVKALAFGVLEHRLVLRPEYEIEGVSVTEVITRVLERVAVPR